MNATKRWEREMAEALSRAIEDTLRKLEIDRFLEDVEELRAEQGEISEELEGKRVSIGEGRDEVEKRLQAMDPDILDVSERVVVTLLEGASKRAVGYEMKEAYGGDIETYVRFLESVEGMMKEMGPLR